MSADVEAVCGAAYGLVGWHTPPHRAIGAALVVPDERGAGIGFLPESWARSLSKRGQLRVLGATPALSPLVYTFQKRRNDERPLLAEMFKAVRASADFATPPRLL